MAVLTLPLTSSVTLAFELLCALTSSLCSGDSYALPCILSAPALYLAQRGEISTVY